MFLPARRSFLDAKLVIVSLAIFICTISSLSRVSSAQSGAVARGKPDGSPPTALVKVTTTSEFRAAIGRARPGTTISVSPGVYEGGSYHVGIAGSPDAPIVIEGADPANRPVFAGGNTGIQFSDANHLVLRDLIFEGARQNGINIDDAETIATPSHHIVFTRIMVRDLPAGLHHGIKLSGVTDFVIEQSVVERWGDGGSAVALIGCHRGIVRNSLFRHTPGMQFGDGVQAKGGSTNIEIRANRFEYAASRAVQIGGVTDFKFFRPQPPDTAEARAILVERNVFIGGETAIAFVSSDGGIVRFNTIYGPAKFLLRILHEHPDQGMAPTQNGLVSDNVFYWVGDLGVNIGDGTKPPSFVFARNWWYRADFPTGSRPALPSGETNGVYGIDPGFLSIPDNFRTIKAIQNGAYAP